MTWRGRANRHKAVGLRHGFRSGLEVRNAEKIESLGHKVIFEQVKIKYAVPMMERTYSLDFELPNGIMVETKGRFMPIDRAKHLYLRTQHPELDIRFVFQRAKTPITKGSKTTYAMWAEKHGFTWAEGEIPDDWFVEPGPHGRPGKAAGARTIPVPQEVKDNLIGGPRESHSAVRDASNRAREMAAQKARPPGRRVSPDSGSPRRRPSAKAR